MKNTEKVVVSSKERLVRFSENGGIVENVATIEKKVKQKNYVIDVKVIEGVKELATQFKVSESRMLEEMYHTFAELLERGKQQGKEKKVTGRGKKEDKAEAKTEDKKAK